MAADKPFVIGIAGPTGSGKTTLAQGLARQCAMACVVSTDAFYPDLSALPHEERAACNFDDPAVVDVALFEACVRALAEGRAAEAPEYDFTTHTRTGAVHRIGPAPVVIVEGLFALHWPEVRRHYSASIFLELDLDACFERRLARDVHERGRTPESVRRQFERTVRPGYATHGAPAQACADIVLDARQSLPELLQRALCEIPGLRGCNT